MKFTKLKLAVLLATATFSTAILANGNEGELHFSGQVVNSPCNIESDSLQQDVAFGQLSRTTLEAGNAAEKNVVIKLKDCNFDEFTKDVDDKWVAVKEMKITFGGKNYVGTDKAFLGTTGTASNIGIQIKDFKYEEAKSVMNQIRNDKGENILEFTALAKRVDAAVTVTEGNFTATADFKIAYE